MCVDHTRVHGLKLLNTSLSEHVVQSLVMVGSRAFDGLLPSRTHITVEDLRLWRSVGWMLMIFSMERVKKEWKIYNRVAVKLLRVCVFACFTTRSVTDSRVHAKSRSSPEANIILDGSK